jgi:hypothetical protein
MFVEKRSNREAGDKAFFEDISSVDRPTMKEKNELHPENNISGHEKDGKHLGE